MPCKQQESCSPSHGRRICMCWWHASSSACEKQPWMQAALYPPACTMHAPALLLAWHQQKHILLATFCSEARLDVCNPHLPREKNRKIHKLLASLVMTSQQLCTHNSTVFHHAASDLSSCYFTSYPNQNHVVMSSGAWVVD